MQDTPPQADSQTAQQPAVQATQPIVTSTDTVAAEAVEHEKEIQSIKEEVSQDVDWQHPVPLLDQLTPNLEIPDVEGIQHQSSGSADTSGTEAS